MRADVDTIFIDIEEGNSAYFSVDIESASGAKLPLANVLNRVQATVADEDIADVSVDGGNVTVTSKDAGSTTITLTYQRLSSSGEYYDVQNEGETVFIEIPVTAGEPVFGDVDGDGQVSKSDMDLVEEYILGNVELTEQQFARADCNEDGAVNVLDLVRIRKAIG